MVAKMKEVTRGPSTKLANARAKAKKSLLTAKMKQQRVEAASRSSGGYGKATVSCWAIPPGGIAKSPAYRLLVTRCGSGAKPPPPHKRAGAPVKGGFPLNKLPPNVLVDGIRSFWLPDDWAQAIKNTGPGGTYIGYVSPKGVYHYHRHGYPTGVEETLGKELTAKDGFNGILRSITQANTGDKTFLQECLTPAERKHIMPADDFHFGVVSARRATDDQGCHAMMVVEAHFRLAGIQPTWYVDADSFEDYKKLGLKVKVGGKLTPARNMVLDDAKKLGKRCVQVSDDISKWEYCDIEKQNLTGQKTFHKANNALAGTRRHIITPLAAAQYILAKMRTSPLKPQLGGVSPTANATMVMGSQEYGTAHFILGDFFVVDKSSCRFDTAMTLKEDYDFTCSHLEKHGAVMRCQRMFVHARHSTNTGGAVATRDQSGRKERQNITILQDKWPGVFKTNKKRKDEVLMRWNNRGKAACEEEETSTSKRKAKVLKKSALKPKAKFYKASALKLKAKFALAKK